VKGKTALITGGAQRLGRATALAFAKEGTNVVIHYRRSLGEAKTLCEEIRERGVEAWSLQADFARREEYDTLVERSVGLAGSLDILVNNASVFSVDPLETVSFERIVSDLEVNVWVPLELSRRFARLGARGAIVNLLDARLAGHDARHAAYVLSKTVLARLTKMLAIELAPAITVNGVAPGLILPPSGKDEAYLQQLAEAVPLKRHGSPEDIARAVVFLAASDFITGEVVYVDGGAHLGGAGHG
jgi:NAD(P)-dependent dehydrogenase (short-subunit alcohol dehydrogenase family)